MASISFGKSSLPYSNTPGVHFVGREGGGTKLRLGSAGQLDPTLFSNGDLASQISIAQEVEAQRGLKREEAEHLANLLAVKRARGEASMGTEEQAIRDAFGQSGGSQGGEPRQSAPTAPSFDLASYIQTLRDAGDKTRSNLKDVYESELSSGVQDISDKFNPIRARQLEEIAGLNGGRFNAPAQTLNTNPIDAEQSKAVTGLVTALRGQRAGALGELEGRLADAESRGREFGTQVGLDKERLGLSRDELGLSERDLGFRERSTLANAIQRSREFGSTFGLEQDKFAEGKRQSALDQVMQREEMEMARQLGEAQARASEPGVLGQVAQVVGGIGGLATGIGAIGGTARGLSTGAKIASGVGAAAKTASALSAPSGLAGAINRSGGSQTNLRARSQFNPYSKVYG